MQGEAQKRSHLIVHIIDDNEANRNLLQDLMDSADLQWCSHVSAMEFLEIFNPEAAGCLVLDVRMPRFNGMQLLEKLKTDGVDVPVILATAHGDVPMAIQAMKQGAFDFHEKPINTNAVLESVYRAIDHRMQQL
ncbi:MAG: DNA-binding response regulator, partial [Nitrospinae bacterium CG11_big_fil_rev_8_21_14_0_20_56_8]